MGKPERTLDLKKRPDLGAFLEMNENYGSTNSSDSEVD